MALVWSPLHPLLLLLGPLVLGASFWATRAGIAYWFERPPSMSWLLMERMRGELCWVVAIRLLLQRMAFGDADATTPLCVAAAALALFVVFDALLTGLRRLTTHDLDEDTMGAPYDAANMERYVCPKARRGKSKEEALAASPNGTLRKRDPMQGMKEAAYNAKVAIDSKLKELESVGSSKKKVLVSGCFDLLHSGCATPRTI